MAENSKKELLRRREELSHSLKDLGEARAQTFRMNSNALALERTGVRSEGLQELARLSAAEVTADDAIRTAQREMRRLDDEIEKLSAGGLASRVGNALRRRRT